MFIAGFRGLQTFELERGFARRFRKRISERRPWHGWRCSEVGRGSSRIRPISIVVRFVGRNRVRYAGYRCR